MQFIHKALISTGNTNLLATINAGASRLFKKIQVLDIASVDISDYNKRYLTKHKSELRATLQKYSHLLYLTLSGTKKNIREFSFVEYGGGSGVMSLLAKEVGVSQVIYNDIYDVSCADAAILGELLGCRAEHYVCGDLDDLISYLETNSISCDGIASYDVIEHIYDVETFLQKLTELPNKRLGIVMASGANIYNPMIVRQLMRMQRRVEYEDRKKTVGDKDRDCYRAYSNVRMDIIREYAADLPDDEVSMLAYLTRGLIKEDILCCTKDYINNKTVPDKINHPTNTCDPYTGNWAEHLMDIELLQGILAHAGYEVTIQGGFYGSYRKLPKKIIARVLNTLIALFGRNGKFFSPFFIIQAK